MLELAYTVIYWTIVVAVMVGFGLTATLMWLAWDAAGLRNKHGP